MARTGHMLRRSWLGGPLSVRAYDVSAVSGDSGWELTTEVHHTFPQAWHGQWQAIAFVDDAHLTVNKNVFAPGPNSATLNGAGVGLNWAGADRWTAGLTVAAPIGSRPELVGGTNSVRAWAQRSAARSRVEPARGRPVTPTNLGLIPPNVSRARVRHSAAKG